MTSSPALCKKSAERRVLHTSMPGPPLGRWATELYATIVCERLFRVSGSPVSSSSFRDFRETDADEIVDLYRAAFGDVRPIDAAQLVSWSRNPEIAPGAMRVLEVDGHVVGYGDVEIHDDEVALEVAAPGQWHLFLDWAKGTALEAGVARVRVLSYSGEELADAAKARGYTLWRSSYSMEIAFDDVPPMRSPIPSGIVLRSYDPTDEARLRAAMSESFADDPFFHEETKESFRHSMLRRQGFDPGIWLLAWEGHELVGFVLAFSKRPGEADLGVIQSLGVRPGWRQRGLGESLVRAALAELYARGLRRVGLGVDAENETGARRLYERVGMNVVQRGDNWALDLRFPPVTTNVSAA